MAVARQAFNSGELSPKLWWRSDLKKYSAGCRFLENFLVTPQGAAWRAPGTVAVARVGAVDAIPEARCMNFDVSKNLSYVIVFIPNGSESDLLVYSTDGGLLATLSAPWPSNEFDELDIKQSYDVLFIAHTNHATRRLERASNTSWSLVQHAFNGGPISAPNAAESWIVKMNTNQWDIAEPYALGAYVQIGVGYSGANNSANYFTHQTVSGFRFVIRRDFYWTKIELATGTAVNFAVGDRITIDSTALAGDWEVQRVDSTGGDDFLYLACGTYGDNGGPLVNDYSGIALGGATIYLQGNKPQLYVALGPTTGDDPTTSPVYWNPIDSLHGTIELESNQPDMFTDADIGRLLRMQYKSNVSDSGTWGVADIGQASKVLPAYGEVTLRTEGGVWEGEVVMQQSFDGGATWEDVAVIKSENGSSNGSVTREITEFGVLVRAFLRQRSDSATGGGPTDTGCNYYLEVSGIQYAYMGITAVTDDQNATAELLNYVPDYIVSWKWAWGAFGGTSGYPGAITIHDERLIVSGVPGEPGRIFGSQVNNWEDWQAGTLKTSPISFTLPSALRDNVRWMVSRQELLIGSDGGEYTLGSRNTDEIMSGDNVRTKQNTQYGSEKISSIATADLIIFVENGGRRLRSLQYSFNDDGYAAIDASILADHLTENETITEMAYSRSPLPVVWCIRSDGVLLCFVYEKINEVNGWSRRTFSDGGKHMSVCVTQSASGDVMWNLVARGDGVYLEKTERTNACIDWSTYIAAADDGVLYPLLGAEPDLLVYDNDWAPVVDPFLGTGIIIDQLTAITDLVIKYDGVQVFDTVDYVELDEGGLIWLYDKTDKTKVEVFDGVTQKTEGVDWKQELATDSVAITIIDDDIRRSR